MRQAVVVDALRSPAGRRGGQLAGVHPADLLGMVLRGLIGRTGIAPELVDDVVTGCVDQVGEQALNIGRSALLGAGLPESVMKVELPGAGLVNATTVERLG